MVVTSEALNAPLKTILRVTRRYHIVRYAHRPTSQGIIYGFLKTLYFLLTINLMIMTTGNAVLHKTSRK